MDTASSAFLEPRSGGAAKAVGGARLFLSHASEDAEAAHELAGLLREGGIAVWLDIDELKPGDNWMERLEQGLQESDHFAVYIGRLGIVRWISREVRVALDRNAKDQSYKVIPILGPGAEPEALPPFLQQHHWLDLRQREANPAAIVGHVLDIVGLPAQVIASGETPFVGLNAFDAETAHLYFGRDNEIAELVDQFSDVAFLAMVGDSGSGKSSLLRAGLLPSLRSGTYNAGEKATPVSKVLIMRPGSDPFRELSHSLIELLPDLSAAEKLAAVGQCRQHLADGTGGLADCIGALASAGQCTVLAIDQFEELFTLVKEEEVRERFIDTLLQAASLASERPCRIVITLRADFYSDCLRYSGLSQAITSSQYAVRPIAGDALVAVIEKPAARTGIELETGLVSAILEDLGSGDVNLPLLQHTLLQLWNRRSGNVLTHQAYNAIGRVQGALEHHAEEVYAGFSPPQQVLARQLLLRLIQPGKNNGATGKRVSKEFLLPNDENRPLAEQILDELVSHRAVTVYGSGEFQEYGLAHEAILGAWSRLTQWLDEDREFLFWRQRLLGMREAWEEAARDPSALLQGAPLVQARHWLAERRAEISQPATFFIRESMRRATRRRRWERIAVSALAVLFVLASAAAIFAFNSRQKAQENLRFATSAVDEMLAQVGSETLRDVPQLESIRKLLLDKARVLYQHLGERQSRSPDVQLSAAMATASVAEIDKQLGDKDAAVRGLHSTIERVQALVDDAPRNSEFKVALASLYSQLGRVLESLGENEQEWRLAEAQFTRAIEMQASLYRANPENLELLLNYARSYLNRGLVYKRKLGRPSLAEQDLLEAIRLVESPAKQSGKPQEKMRQQLGRSHNTLANLLAGQSMYARALKHNQRASENFLALHNASPVNREYTEELAKTYNNRASLLTRADRGNSTVMSEALEYNDQAIALFESLSRPLPTVVVELANAQSTRADFLLRSRSDGASELYASSAELLEKLLQQFPNDGDYLWLYAVALTKYGYSQLVDAQKADAITTRSHLSPIVQRLAKAQRERLQNHPRYRALQDAG